MFDSDPRVALLALAGRAPDGWLALVRAVQHALANPAETPRTEAPSHELMVDVDERQRLLDYLAGGEVAQPAGAG
jgi:hypothetical protein